MLTELMLRQQRKRALVLREKVLEFLPTPYALLKINNYKNSEEKSSFVFVVPERKATAESFLHTK